MSASCVQRLIAVVGTIGLAAAFASARLPAGELPRFDPEAGLPLVQNFPPEIYQAHAQIFASTQAPDGVLYFGTFGNVVSFDGERWRRHSVPGAWIRALAVGPDGLVYVGGAGVLGRLEPAADTGLLHFVSLVPRVPAEFANFATAWSVARHDDAMFFAIDGAVLEWSRQAFRATPFPGQRPALRPAGTELFCHLGDTLLVRRGGKWVPHARDARLGETRRITVIDDGARGLVIGRDDGRVLRLSPDGTALTEWAAMSAALQPVGLRNGVRLDDGRFVMSTGGEGILLLAPDGTPLQRLTGDHGLAQTSTYGFTRAADGTLWIETANGLSHYDPRATWSVFDQRNGRPAGIGGEPFTGPEGTLFQFSDVGAIRLQPARNGLESARMVVLPGLPARMGNMVLCQNAVITGNERGLMRLATPVQHLYAADSQIEDILPLPHDASLLAIGMIRGLEVVRVSPTLSVQPLGRVPGFDAEVTDVEAGPDDTLWIGTVAGYAFRVRRPPDEDWSRAEGTRFDATRGLPDGAVWVKTVRAGADMLVWTQAGVYRWDRGTDRLEPHPAFAKHVPAGVNNLPGVTDERGRFWFQIALPDGGFQPGCLDTRGAAPVWTPLPASVAESLGYGGARVIAYQYASGRELLWLSGTRNTVRYDLQAATPPPPAPATLLTEISQGSRQWAPARASHVFAFSREPLRFHFASPAAANGRVAYETRLVGYQPAWSSADGASAVFTNLYGDAFRFEVRARDGDGITGPAVGYEFSVSPPWNRSLSAYAVYAFVALGGMAGFIRWRLHRARREHVRLEQLVATRTTELANARDQAETASRAKSAFLASMSHELRTPLNGVIGYAQVLQGDARLLPDQQERLRIVRSSGEHLLRMINDVLDLAKIEAGKLEVRLAPFSLGDLLRDIAAAHAPAAAAEHLVFTLEAAADLPAVIDGDAQKLRQVLDNLVGNAIKFTTAGSVKLHAHRTDPGRRAARSASPFPSGSREDRPLPSSHRIVSITFAVVDTGPGIAPPDQARLFQPFEQAKDPRANVPGTGLGLAISRALVEHLGGSLELASVVGAGSTFSFSLPFAAGATNVAPASAPVRVTGYTGPRRRVLIVDDHPVNRGLLVDLLQPLGFTCDAHASGAGALAALTADPASWPDLALLDVRMEGIDGLELTRRLRALAGNRPVRVLLTSASVLTFNPAEGHAAGCDDFLPKPFRAPDLIEKTGRLLGLVWTETSHAAAPPDETSAVPPLPESVRAALRDAMALGDLDEVRRQIAAGRAAYPDAGALWQKLDEAAAEFQLSRLRQLLDHP